jgi:hypothetical protein
MRDFTGPWSAPRPLNDMVAALSPEALRRFIGGLTQAEYEAFWRQLVEEADRVPPADPKEALRWYAHKEQSAIFDRWFATLELVEKSKAYLAFVAGTPIEELCPWLQTSQLSNEKPND